MHCFPQVDGGNFKEEKAASASLSPRSQTKFEIISDLFSYSNKFTFISPTNSPLSLSDKFTFIAIFKIFFKYRSVKFEFRSPIRSPPHSLVFMLQFLLLLFLFLLLFLNEGLVLVFCHTVFVS